jgi:hypothetical protein
MALSHFIGVGGHGRGHGSQSGAAIPSQLIASDSVPLHPASWDRCFIFH